MLAILAFGSVGQGEVFLLDHLRRERNTLNERVDDLIVERDRYLKEFQGVFNMLLAIEADVESFKEPGTLVEKE